MAPSRPATAAAAPCVKLTRICGPGLRCGDRPPQRPPLRGRRAAVPRGSGARRARALSGRRLGLAARLGGAAKNHRRSRPAVPRRAPEHRRVLPGQRGRREDPASPFDRPYLREFDLLAGRLDGAAGGPLATVAHIEIEGSDRAWRRAVHRGRGVPAVFPGARPRRARVPVRAQDRRRRKGGAAAGAARTSPSREIAHDDKKIYLLRGYDRRLGRDGHGHAW